MEKIKKYICPLATEIPDKLDSGVTKPLLMAVIVGHTVFTTDAFDLLQKYYYHEN